MCGAGVDTAGVSAPFREAEALPDVVARLFPRAPARVCAAAPIAAPRRRKLWEIGTAYHCVVIGSCMPMDELRRLGERAGIEDAHGLNDYGLHHAAVSLARDRNAFSELLQKSLERRYAAHVQRYARARSSDACAALWKESLAGGDVRGALWALVSHPYASEAVLVTASEDMHMLSHQVGAANRADLRRLAGLESETRELRAALERLRERYAAVTSEKDALARRVDAMLARERALLAAEARLTGSAPDALVQAERARADQAANRAAALELALARSEARCAALDFALSQARRTPSEPAPAEVEPRDEAAPPVDTADLCGRRVLCVGGRTGTIEQYRRFVENCRGEFIHHDGGIEDNPKRLHHLLGGADIVVCAVAHVSHGAYYVLKRYCRRAQKPCVLLKNPGLGSFCSGLVAGVARAGWTALREA